MDEDIIIRELQAGNRPRSRTWPLPQPEEVEVEKTQEEKTSTKLEGAKKGSRKNAWGSLSYADLITQAITSSPDQRMTLSQIYTWMVDNIPYFKDKGDSTSSAGWKNSIRHNLSLHSRFTRIQNEGNGKSSWWILDHEAKAEKTKRRGRSSSLDSEAGGPKTTKPKRGRKATKRSENVDDQPQSPSTKCRGALAPKSPISGEPSVIVEENPFPFPIADYRHRSSSNTSNVSSIGRLSPIPSHEEDNTDMAMSPVQDHGETTPVVVEELMDNMSIGKSQGDISTQFPSRCSSDDATNMAAVQAMNIESPPSFVDNRYPTTNEYYQAHNLKQTAFTPTKITSQKNLFGEQIYHRGSPVSPNQFPLPERSITQPFIRQPPTYSHALLVNNRPQKPKPQQSMSRLAFQGNSFSPFIPMPRETVPLISVEMADNLPVDTDIDFLEGDIECDVENVLRSELAFNDGYLDFNLDNYVPAIALPEMPRQSYVSGNMVH